MRLADLRRLGFDHSYHIPFTKRYHVACSQCQALCINGIACHETGCSHEKNGEEDEIEKQHKFDEVTTV